MCPIFRGRPQLLHIPSPVSSENVSMQIINIQSDPKPRLTYTADGGFYGAHLNVPGGNLKTGKKGRYF